MFVIRVYDNIFKSQFETMRSYTHKTIKITKTASVLLFLHTFHNAEVGYFKINTWFFNIKILFPNISE